MDLINVFFKKISKFPSFSHNEDGADYIQKRINKLNHIYNSDWSRDNLDASIYRDADIQKLKEEIKNKQIELTHKTGELIDDKKYEEALRLVEKVIKASQNIQVPQHWNNKSVILRKLGREKEAEKSFKMSQELYKEKALSYYKLGKKLIENDSNEAINCFKQFFLWGQHYKKSTDQKFNEAVLESKSLIALALVNIGKDKEALDYVNKSFLEEIKLELNKYKSKK